MQTLVEFNSKIFYWAAGSTAEGGTTFSAGKGLIGSVEMPASGAAPTASNFKFV